jgi:hypothetical protein
LPVDVLWPQAGHFEPHANFFRNSNSRHSLHACASNSGVRDSCGQGRGDDDQLPNTDVGQSAGDARRATLGEEIRYLDSANDRMRLERYILSGAGKKLYQTTIINQTGSYRLDPAKNEAVFVKMATPVPVWNFDDNISVAWAGLATMD